MSEHSLLCARCVHIRRPHSAVRPLVPVLLALALTAALLQPAPASAATFSVPISVSKALRFLDYAGKRSRSNRQSSIAFPRVVRRTFSYLRHKPAEVPSPALSETPPCGTPMSDQVRQFWR